MPFTDPCALGGFLQEKNQANQVLLEELTERAATLEREKRRLQNALEEVTRSAQVLTDALFCDTSTIHLLLLSPSI